MNVNFFYKEKKKKKKKVHSRINSEVEKMCAQIFCPIISTLDKLGLTLSLFLSLFAVRFFFLFFFGLNFIFQAPMEGSTSQPSDSNPTAPGASKFLTGLPSRGLFSSTVISSNPVNTLSKLSKPFNFFL